MTHLMVDLCLGSDIGRRVLSAVSAPLVSTVYSRSEQIRLLASEMGFNVCSGDLNSSHSTEADVAISVHYPVILNEATIQRYQKVYNVHPGFLPWGRGWYPVFWALFRGEPAGATLHEIDTGLDSGPIVKQVAVAERPEDDGRSLHQRVTTAEEELFGFLLEELTSGRIPSAMAQDLSQGSYHSKDEFFRWKRNPPLAELSSKELLNLIRALSYRGYSGLELDRGSQRFSVTMEAVDENGTMLTHLQNGRSKQT